MVVFLRWLLLLITCAPAMIVGVPRGGRMATMTGQKSLVTGLAGGLVGVGHGALDNRGFLHRTWGCP